MLPFQPSYQWPPDIEQALNAWTKTVASAGAGTGKTAFATDKVLRSVARGGISVPQVVCITFTKKAAGELKSRLRQLFLDQFHATGHPVWRTQARLIEQAPFSTIHSLALRILQEHPLEAGFDLGFTVLEQDEARRLLKEATENVLRRRFLDDDGIYAELADRYGWEDRRYQPGLHKALAEAFQHWFEAGADVEGLQQRLPRNWTEAPEVGPAFARVFVEIAQEYAALKEGVLDFHDLLRRAAQLLRDRPDIRRQYQERWALVILDEAQDTEPVQMELISYLAQEPGDTRCWPFLRLGNKLLVVGDLKQAIYRFRGADHEQFEEMIQVLEQQEGVRVDLRENRRCHPAIIRFVNALAPSLFQDLLDYRPERDDLIPRRQVPDDGPRVWYLTRQHAYRDTAEVRRRAEAEDLARLIVWLTDPQRSPVKVFDTDNQPPRTPCFGDIAILFSAVSGKLHYYTAALDRHHIPYHTERGRSFFLTQEVRDTLAFLRLVQNPEDRLALAEVLRNPVVGLSDSEWVQAMQTEGGTGGVSPRITPAEATVPPLADSTPESRETRAVWLYQLLDELRQIKDRLPIAELLERWWQATAQRPALACDEQGRQHLANLAKLQQMAREADRAGLTLRQFIDQLLDATVWREEPQAPIVGEGDNVVRLLTAHASKGLEFKIVILADCAGPVGRFQTSPVVFDRTAGLLGKFWDPQKEKLRPTAAYRAWMEREKARLEEDQRKLLYVAATRARDLLIFSGSPAPTKSGRMPDTSCWRKWIELDHRGRPSPALKYVHYVQAEELVPVTVPSGRVLWPREQLPPPPVTELPETLPGADGLTPVEGSPWANRWTLS